MPGEAVQIGGATYVFPPDRIAAALETLVATGVGATTLSSTTSDMGAGEEILIAEDSATQALLLQNILQNHGFRVTGRAMAGSRWRRLGSCSRRWSSPISRCRRWMASSSAARSRPTRAGAIIPVMLLTSLSSPQDIIHGLECGADNFVVKPYDEEFLLARIRTYSRESRAATGVAANARHLHLFRRPSIT